MSTEQETRQILLTLVQRTEGRSWAEGKVGWTADSDTEVCFWEGIVCGPDKKTVTGIVLPYDGLSGTIPPELGSLPSLKELSLPQNEIVGSIPQALADSPTLEVLNLVGNFISGHIPRFASSRLATLRLATNNLGGPIPEDTGATNPNLVTYSIIQNSITGTIPESFSRIGTLDTLSLSENELSGTIPDSLGSITSLRYLYLDHNHFQGAIPPALARFSSSLAEIWLHENQLSGTIPAEIADLTNLFNFYIDGNKFTGSVPKELCRKQLNEDFFQNVPEADRDYCQSVACPVGYVAPQGLYPCKECDAKYYNPYLGRVGECIDTNELNILNEIYVALNGPNWDSIDTPWTESDPCSFTGIGCDNKGNVQTIDLKNKGLMGKLPENIGFLRYLTSLDLSDNQLTGYLPSDLRWAPLQTLDVSGNQLKGIVPLTLCQKEGINGNGDDGTFSCERIACPVGTFSPNNGMRGNGYECTPCSSPDKAPFLASTECIVTNTTHPSTINPLGEYGHARIFGAVAGGLFFVILMIYFSAKLIVSVKRRRKGHVVLGQGDDAVQDAEEELGDNFTID